MSKTICFTHYGIGWKDGINVVIENLAKQIQKQRPNLGLCFLAGEIEERILKNSQLKNQVFKENKEMIIKQIQVIQNKEIIEKNFQVVNQIYNISEITKRFLNLIRL